MASETVDPINWSLLWPVPPERLVHNINRCSLSSTGNRPWNLINHTIQPPCLYAATLGILLTSPNMYRKTVVGTDTTVVINSWNGSDYELRKSPDKLFQVLMALQWTKSWECVIAYNGILKSPLFLSLIWCLTSPWMRNSFSRYVPLITL